MNKNDYRKGNETMINYFNKITAKLCEYEFEELEIVRTETFMNINNEIEHFTIEVTIKNGVPTTDIDKFYLIMEQEILPDYMKCFYNTVDFKVELFDESGKTEKIVRTFDNKQMEQTQIETKEESSEEEI